MRKVFNKVMAGAMTTALVATLAVGFKVNTTDVKADTANALTGSWTSSAESYEPNDAVITQTTFKSTAVDNVSANISITGWQANWTGRKLLLRKINCIKIKSGVKNHTDYIRN